MERLIQAWTGDEVLEGLLIGAFVDVDTTSLTFQITFGLLQSCPVVPLAGLSATAG